MTTPIVFDVQGSDIRFGTTEDGTPYSVAADFAKTMGYGQASDATRLLAEDEKGQQIVLTPGGPQQLNVIYEDGMWELIFRSSLPGAKAIKAQVKAILKQIRETGSYSATPVAALPDITTAAGVLAMAEAFAATARQLVAADDKIRELEPKALVHDTLMAVQDGDRLVRQAAKDLGWRESDLRGFLLDEKLIYRRQRTCGGWEYDFYAAHAESFNSVEKVVEHTWGSCAHYTLHVTPRGLSFIQMRIGKRQAAMAAAIEGGTR